MSTAALYLDTSAILRATIEAGTSAEIDDAIARATELVTSRLTKVEVDRAFLRLRRARTASEGSLVDREREVEAILRRCEFFEVSEPICALAGRVAPESGLRALDAIHLATFLEAKRRLEGLELLTADERLRRAAE